MLRLDHVIFACADLDAEAERWRRDYGLASVKGGRHARWGTENRIVPLGAEYLELAGVADRDAAQGNAFGRAILDAPGKWLGPVVATDELDAVAARLELDVVAGSRRRPDGRELQWRSAGLEDPRRAWWMPFFLEWDVPPELHPGREVVEHRTGVRRIASVEIAADPARLRSWVGEADLPFWVVEGPGEVRRVVLETSEGSLTIE